MELINGWNPIRNMKSEKAKSIFIQGAITAGFISESIARHQQKTKIGAHSIFLGQVRADQKEGESVSAIEYSAYEEMANEKMHAIREEIIQKHALSCMHVYHSLGRVVAGEICLFVFTSSAHRQAAIEACEETVERIKAELPIWGKELITNESSQWKKNT